MPRLTHSFQSTAIQSAAYDTETNELEVTFVNGGTYTHEGVPEQVWDAFTTDRSAGSYYARQIKGRF
jgi:hypothetical protein